MSLSGPPQADVKTCPVPSRYPVYMPPITIILFLAADVISACWSLALVFKKDILIDSLKTGLRKDIADKSFRDV